ncbi:MAG: tRNA(His) guanylyltransferase Thg1 family protein [Nostocaceae cyanobacterium]|nr:tRNA(His) guanylyltransferase Thg1 family protein [Nostocaceae cyanobacterium]
MKFDELDSKMRVFETAHDHCVLPGMYIIARLDGRSFTRLTKEVYQFEVPFDECFRNYMLGTVEHLMNCGLSIVYGYTQSDEISLLFALHDNSFNRKLRKLNSVLAGEASAKLSLLLGDIASFDCRISQLPNIEEVVNYFRWRQEDAHRNSLNAHCYWSLRRDGKTPTQASKMMQGLSVGDKNELLFQYGINFNQLPNWQKRGMGLYWEEYEKLGYNPIQGETVPALRRQLCRDFNLPMKEEYSQLILQMVETIAN